MFTSSYLQYLESQHWSELRQTCFNRSNRKCEACESKVSLQGHHLIYRNPLETCTAEDIMTLCDRCHELFHNWLKQIDRKVLSFCRQSTRGAILALLYPATHIPRKNYPAYVSINPPKAEQKKSRKQERASVILRRAMSSDERIVSAIRSCKTRKQFKNSVKYLADNYPGCSGFPSFMTNVLLVHKRLHKTICN